MQGAVVPAPPTASASVTVAMVTKTVDYIPTIVRYTQLVTAPQNLTESTSVVTIQVSGRYRIAGSVMFSAISASFLDFAVQKNGANTLITNYFSNGNNDGSESLAYVEGVLDLLAGDTINMYAGPRLQALFQGGQFSVNMV